MLASLVFFCPINDHFKVSFYLKATLYDCKNDSKYRDVAPLRPKKQVRIVNAELEPVLRSKVIDYLLPCVQSKWSKNFSQFPVEAFLSQEVSSYRHIDLRNELSSLDRQLTEFVSDLQILLIAYPV